MYTAGDFATPAPWSRRVRERREQISLLRDALRGRAYDRALSGDTPDLVSQVEAGLRRLETHEPGRLPALYASVANGRGDAVIDALTAYRVPVPVGAGHA